LYFLGHADPGCGGNGNTVLLIWLKFYLGHPDLVGDATATGHDQLFQLVFRSPESEG
jgi:hypothetical protein